MPPIDGKAYAWPMYDQYLSCKVNKNVKASGAISEPQGGFFEGRRVEKCQVEPVFRVFFNFKVTLVKRFCGISPSESSPYEAYVFSWRIY